MASRVLAGLDVGSGATKLFVCRAELHPVFKVTQVLLEKETEILLQHDTDSSGGGKLLGNAVLQKCKEVLKSYQSEAKALGAEELGGVATQVFRSAKNGAQFIEEMRTELGIELQVVSQEREGELGFATASALASDSLPSGQTLMSWDSGGGSFQLAMDNGKTVFKGPLGSSSVTAGLVRLQGKEFLSGALRTSPNPASESHIAALKRWIGQALEGPIAAHHNIVEKAPTSFIVGIGGQTSAFRICSKAIQAVVDDSSPGHRKITRENLGLALYACTGKTDADFEAIGFPPALQPDMILPKLCLVHTVMELLHLDTIYFYPSTGSCLGYLALRHSKSVVPPST